MQVLEVHSKSDLSPPFRVFMSRSEFSAAPGGKERGKMRVLHLAWAKISLLNFTSALRKTHLIC